MSDIKAELLKKIGAVKNERGGKFWTDTGHWFDPSFNGQPLNKVNYQELDEVKLLHFYEAITRGVSRAGGYV